MWILMKVTNLGREFCCFQMLKNVLPSPAYVFVTQHYIAQRKIWIFHPGSHPDISHHPHLYRKCLAWTAPSGGKIWRPTAVCNQKKDWVEKTSKPYCSILPMNTWYIPVHQTSLFQTQWNGQKISWGTSIHDIEEKYL